MEIPTDWDLHDRQLPMTGGTKRRSGRAISRRTVLKRLALAVTAVSTLPTAKPALSPGEEEESPRLGVVVVPGPPPTRGQSPAEDAVKSRPFSGTEQFTPSKTDGSPHRGSTCGRAVQFCTDISSLNRLPFNLDGRGIHCQLPRMGKELTVGRRNRRAGADLKLQHRLSQPSWRSGHVEKPKRVFDQTHPV
jgi:hypothetical protein